MCVSLAFLIVISVGLLSPSSKKIKNRVFLSLLFYNCPSLYILNTFSCLGYQRLSIAFLIVILVGSPSINKRKTRVLFI